MNLPRRLHVPALGRMFGVIRPKLVVITATHLRLKLMVLDESRGSTSQLNHFVQTVLPARAEPLRTKPARRMVTFETAMGVQSRPPEGFSSHLHRGCVLAQSACCSRCQEGSWGS